MCFFFWSCLAAVIVSKDYGTLLCQRITVLLYIVVVAARERTRPPRQVGPPVLLRPRLREPPAVIEAISGLGHPCKTQAARGARAEALAAGVGAMLTHHFLELDASGSASHPGAVCPRGEPGRLLRQGVFFFGAEGVSCVSTESKRTRPPARRFESRSGARLADALSGYVVKPRQDRPSAFVKLLAYPLYHR